MKGDIPQIENRQIPEGAEDEDLALSLKKAIDANILEGLTGTKRTIKGFHPSNTTECPRYLVYMFRGEWLPPHNNPRLQRIFDTGHSMHKRMGDYFEKMGIVVALEKSVNTTLYHIDKDGKKWPVPIEGTCDGIIDWNGHKVIEFKSISDMGFAQRRVFGKPKPDHVRQTQIYLAALDLQIGYVIYENKNNQEILIFEVERDQVFLDKLFKKYAKIFKTFKDGKLPTRYKSPTCANCQYCNLNKKCWSDSDEGIKM